MCPPQSLRVDPKQRVALFVSPPATDQAGGYVGPHTCRKTAAENVYLTQRQLIRCRFDSHVDALAGVPDTDVHNAMCISDSIGFKSFHRPT
jgi:hypothetical protein